ncbi:outer membrane efflux protein [Thioalkalivibrio sp. K90mix]|uniref:TolC family protein n=1 Tax=unclassified Thioalkalivibrio TaxID=2621013 RepID=UPI000195AB86|nr:MULTISPECIES: TolC family protein [unclassified Thioalkalivibrio]ADC71858.1 outer membrane efflux protein [Thioalkalivibrio sp. K90mix]
MPRRYRAALPLLASLALAIPATAEDDEPTGNGLRLSLPAEQLMAIDPFGREPVGEETLSLEEAVARALEGNRGLRAERLQTAIAGTFEAQERAVFDPELFAEVEVTRDQSVRLLEEAEEDTDEVTSTQRFGEAGVRQSLPTGTDLSLSVRSQRATSSRVDQTQFSSRAGLTLTQALLRGGRIESNLVRLQQAGLDVEATEYEVRAFVEQLITDVETAYWDLVLAGEQIEIFEEALAVASQQLDETQRRIDAGDRPETEAVSARAEVALRRQGLIDARSERARAQDTLARLIQGDGGLWDTRLLTSSEPALDRYEIEPLDTYVALARDHRADLNETRLRVQRDELEVIRTRNGLLPRLDFFVTLGQSGYADSFGRTFRDTQGDGYDLAAGLRFEMPIGNRAAEAEHTRARLTRQQISETLANLEQLAIEDVRAVWFDAARVREQIRAQEETIELQEELLRVEQTRYRVGAGTALAVAQAQRDLLESRLRLTETVVRFRQLTTELLNASGTLLLHRGIDAPGSERVDLRM